MKEYKFLLTQNYIDKYFSPIRERVNIIELLMESIKYMLINPKIDPKNKKGEMVLKIDKMSRLFYFSENKYFSIVFPFFVKEIDSKYTFYTNFISNIDHKLVSNVLSIIKDSKFNAISSLTFAELLYETEEEFSEPFWAFFKKLLLLEDGYIRYDYDNENYLIHKELGEEHKHPENHYDIFYSNSSTFKIGLKNRILYDDFMDLLNITTNCRYLSDT